MNIFFAVGPGLLHGFIKDKTNTNNFFQRSFSVLAARPLKKALYLKKGNNMNDIFADRITDVPRSFIREILKVALDPEVISFAGGLPNRDLFPVQELTNATSEVFSIYGRDIFQYSNSEGYLKLRENIAENYQKKGLSVSPENILITNGAQQGLDLLGKVLLNDGDVVVLEEPGYLGAIQAFSLYKPTFLPVKVSEQGMNIDGLQKVFTNNSPKLVYSVPNFQNPSGITYSNENRQEIASIIQDKTTFLIEDNPYGDLRFSGEPQLSFKHYLPEKVILLGSFSKIVVPGFRIGWIVAPDNILQKLLVAKQASDLHTCHFTQYIIYQYLQKNDIQRHIEKVAQKYGEQCQSMLESMEKYFPACVAYTKPEGGMFLWVTLPADISAMDLFEISVKEKVVFVPGNPFYINNNGENTFRLNFSCTDKQTTETGIKRLGGAIETLQKRV
ncbi:PLP-dependent aminotransferase family protein [Desulfotignum balticum]|uniref:aminotransferase-like domain-containing protein n=1 Tax=Desulfotignum balticum TaxID=115781 RepID=UPI00040CEAF8|nr:PLP-dependent aminotransferase family protein [Desulfotignum balticum]